MKRNEIAEEYKWDLGHIYPSRLDWEKAFSRTSARLGELKKYKGKLSNPGFVAKAPAQLVEAEKRKLSEFEQLKAKLSARMKDLTD